MFSKVIEGLACTFENDFAWRHRGKCIPLLAIIIAFESHARARMHCSKRFRVAVLRNMSTPLGYNHCFRESLRGSHVLVKTISRSGIEKHVNPLSYNHCFRKSLKGLHVLLKTISHSGIEENVNPFSYNHCFRKSLEGSHVLLKIISHSGIEENVNPSQL